MDGVKLGLKVGIELKRKFREYPQAADAWMRLREEGAKAERVSPRNYAANGIREAHFDEAHEIFMKGNGWEVKSDWFVLLPPKEWPGGRHEADEAAEELRKETKAMAKRLGFWQAEVTVTVVPEEEWE